MAFLPLDPIRPDGPTRRDLVCCAIGTAPRRKDGGGSADPVCSGPSIYTVRQPFPMRDSSPLRASRRGGGAGRPRRQAPCSIRQPPLPTFISRSGRAGGAAAPVAARRGGAGVEEPFREHPQREAVRWWDSYQDARATRARTERTTPPRRPTHVGDAKRRWGRPRGGRRWRDAERPLTVPAPQRGGAKRPSPRRSYKKRCPGARRAAPLLPRLDQHIGGRAVEGRGTAFCVIAATVPLLLSPRQIIPLLPPALALAA